MADLAAVVFDLDGVLVDSEQVWDAVRRQVVAEHGGAWTEEATAAMLGMSTPEWARYLVDVLGARLDPGAAAKLVIGRMADRYAEGPPLLPDAVDAVRAVAEDYPVAIATSSPPVLIRSFLDGTGLAGVVRAAVSSEEVGAGKPAPDVYLEATGRLGVPAADCAAVEDSTNGLRAALAAGMTVLAVPNPHFPPDEDVLARAAAVLGGVGEVPAALRSLPG
ncbi:HAD family hydrolase [Gandjariella thermophila]|uniref:Haloacid dehalogenase n=1 Tax=Gandjariella thermophila TaxID=1931992 RepID=A0A4D4J313_9PSEU|nr:HAD family phosphatase [Gandjariella thermophila]GDY30881.1 haloacid dehalogenase [Gandjariella thermophila]